MKGKKKYLVILIFLIVSILIAGCSSATASKPLAVGSIVSCDKFWQVTDKYKTPDGQYHVSFYGGGVGYTSKVVPEFAYNNVPYNKGYLVWVLKDFEGYNTYNFTALTEEQSGMRGACRIVP